MFQRSQQTYANYLTQELEKSRLREAADAKDAEIARLRADVEKYKEWCRKLIEAGDFSHVATILRGK